MDDVRQVVRAGGEGPVFRQILSIGESRFLPKALQFPSMTAEVEERAHGLGLAMARIRFNNLGFQINHVATTTPIDETRAWLAPLLNLIPQGFLYLQFARLISPIFTYINSQDIDIWSHKTYIEKPLLIAEDGEIYKYRKWAKQFYESSPKG